jgi:hypothetical protein
MNDIPENVKLALVKNQLAMWQNTYFDEQIKARVAKTLHDEQMLNSAKGQMERALKAQDELEKIIAEIETAVTSPNGHKEPDPA